MPYCALDRKIDGNSAPGANRERAGDNPEGGVIPRDHREVDQGLRWEHRPRVLEKAVRHLATDGVTSERRRHPQLIGETLAVPAASDDSCSSLMPAARATAWCARTSYSNSIPWTAPRMAASVSCGDSLVP